MSNYYDTMQVCKKWGHKITDRYNDYPNHRQEFCDQCGSVTVNACEHCKTKIKGFYHIDNVLGGNHPEVPLHCHKCGKAYPWKNRLLIKRSIKRIVAPAKYLVDSIVRIFKK